MYYFEVTDHDLQDARPGLELIEKLLANDASFEPYIYGMTSKPDVLLAAQAALAEDGDEEEVPTLTEVAVALRLTSENILALTGSGVKLQNEEFAYVAGEGARTLSLRFSRQTPRINAGSLQRLAIAENDMYLDSFLDQYGGKKTLEGKIERAPVPATKAASRKAPKKARIAPAHAIDEFLK